MFAVNLRRAEETRSYSIAAKGSSGWEMRLEENHTVQRIEHYNDWHRVERAQMLIEREVSELAADGWLVAPAKINQ